MTTAVSWATYTVCMLLLGDRLAGEWSTLISGVVSWIVAVTFSFVVNKWLVFHSESRAWRVLLKEAATFYSTRLLVGTLEIALPPVVVALGWDVPLFGVEGLLSKCLVTPVLILLNFLCGKFLVFRNAQAKEEAES